MRWAVTIKRSNVLTGVDQEIRRTEIEADTEAEAREKVAATVAETIENTGRAFEELGANPFQVAKCIEAEKVEIVSVLPAPERMAEFVDTCVVEINGKRMEVDMLKLLKVARLDDTPQNRELAVALLQEEVAGKSVAGAESLVKHAHKHLCVGCDGLFAHEGKRKNCKLARKAWCPNCQS